MQRGPSFISIVTVETTFEMGKSSGKKKNENKRGKALVWSEAMTELPKLCLGGFAMIVSSYANQGKVTGRE